jgi:UDP-N-acetylglucosamine 2-epimerase (non-hydrolysing)
MENKKLKVVTVVGTRPEIIRLSLIIKKFDKHFDHKFIHTGQNYDFELNEIFFQELDIRKPDFFLEVANENLGDTIGNIISKSYNIFKDLQPDALFILGDTNSSLCEISAKRLKIPIFHYEAGNRCFDLNVPEEINRKIADHLADVNLTYSSNSKKYLIGEGFRKDFVISVGSPMKEILDNYKNEILKSNILNTLDLNKNKYILASIHREENLDLEKNFQSIIESINYIAEQKSVPVIFSTHPRTKKKIQELGILSKKTNIKFIKPLGFFDYVKLQINSLVTLSDSGTLSEESSILNFPAVIVRTSTERPEAIEFGNILLGNIDKNNLFNSVEITIDSHSKSDSYEIPVDYNVNNVSQKIVKIIQGYTEKINAETWKKNRLK